MEAWLNDVNEAVLFSGLLLLLLGSTELGLSLARREARGDGQIPPHAASMQGAVLGLLALLLGFTFSLALGRFEARKALYRDEANALGTTYLRVQLLPEPARSALPALLRKYADTRVELAHAAYDKEHVRRIDAQATALQHEIWALAVAAARATPESELTSLFVESLNQTIDMHGLRIAAIRNYAPALLFIVLFAVAAVAMGLSGYASEPARGTARGINALMALLLTVVTVVVIDLHRPARGLIVADPISLVELRDSMR